MNQSGVGRAIHWGFVGRRYLYNSQKNIPERYRGKSKNCLEDRYWSWFLWGIWSWLYSSYGFKELCAWTSIHINWSILNLSILNTRNLILHVFAKYHHPTSILSLFSEIIERFGNNRLVDHLRKTGLFMVSWFLVQL